MPHIRGGAGSVRHGLPLAGCATPADACNMAPARAHLPNPLTPLARLADYGIAYGYTPVLLAHPDTLRRALRCLADGQLSSSYGEAAPLHDASCPRA